jgi:hypothetical protein
MEGGGEEMGASDRWATMAVRLAPIIQGYLGTQSDVSIICVTIENNGEKLQYFGGSEPNLDATPMALAPIPLSCNSSHRFYGMIIKDFKGFKKKKFTCDAVYFIKVFVRFGLAK